MREKFLGQDISWEGFASQLMKKIVQKINTLLNMVRLTASEKDFMT